MARKRSRRSGKLAGAAHAAKHAPAHCKRQLSHCMTGKGSRSKSSHCMKSFWSCRRG